MRRSPLTPIFNYEPMRGSIVIGGTPSVAPPSCPDPGVLTDPPFDDPDLVAFVPKVCGGIFEAVSGIQATPGTAFSSFGGGTGNNYTMESGSAGLIVSGTAPSISTTDDDFSVHWRGELSSVSEIDALIRMGNLNIEIVDIGSSVFKFAARKDYTGGSITAIGTTTIAADTEYDVYAAWDRDMATVAIIVDGTEEDTTEDAASYVNTPNLQTFSAKLPANSWCTELAAWDRVVSPASVLDQYDASVLADSPEFYLQMRTPAPGNEPDQTGNGHTGTWINGADFDGSDPPFDGGGDGRFDGTDDYMGLANATNMEPYWPCTFEAFVYHTGDELIIFDRRGSAGGHLCMVNTSDKIQVTYYGSSAGATSTTSVPRNQWVHVAVTIDSGTYTFYLDGVEVETVSNATVPSSTVGVNADNFVMARGGSSGVGFANYSGGRIAHVAYYRSALSGTRIAAHYAAAGII